MPHNNLIQEKTAYNKLIFNRLDTHKNMMYLDFSVSVNSDRSNFRHFNHKILFYNDAQGFVENRQVAIEAGTSAGKALETFESDSGVKVITGNNFKAQIEEAKQKAIENKEK